MTTGAFGFAEKSSGRGDCQQPFVRHVRLRLCRLQSRARRSADDVMRAVEMNGAGGVSGCAGQRLGQLRVDAVGDHVRREAGDRTEQRGVGKILMLEVPSRVGLHRVGEDDQRHAIEPGMRDAVGERRHARAECREAGAGGAGDLGLRRGHERASGLRVTENERKPLPLGGRDDIEIAPTAGIPKIARVPARTRRATIESATVMCKRRQGGNVHTIERRTRCASWPHDALAIGRSIVDGSALVPERSVETNRSTPACPTCARLSSRTGNAQVSAWRSPCSGLPFSDRAHRHAG